MVENGAQRPRKERTVNADKRRRQILDATYRSIVANGLAKTTLATVAAEAGLSQGVAVFYFKSKNGLLSEALRDLYQKYELHWQSALEKAEKTPAEQLRAIIKADFDPKICNPEILSVWFAFWGEQKFTPQYEEITVQYDHSRSVAIQNICRELCPGNPDRGDLAAEWIETLTDGYWQRLQLYPQGITNEIAIERTFQVLPILFPESAKDLAP